MLRGFVQLGTSAPTGGTQRPYGRHAVEALAVLQWRSSNLMWQYLLYFVMGGVTVATVAYICTHHGGLVAAFVTGLPVFFLVSLTLNEARRRGLYPQQGSTDSSLSVFSQRRDEGADQ